MSSEFPPADDIDVTVLRRSTWVLDGFGGWLSVLADVLLESHEKGPASFLGGGAGAGEGDWVGKGFGAGGGPQGTEGRDPDKPCERKGTFEGPGEAEAVILVEADSSIIVSFAELVTDPGAITLLVLVDVIPGLSPSCTSSKDEVEMRRAVSNGDFVEGSSSLTAGSMSSPGGLGVLNCRLAAWPAESCDSDARGVVTDEVEGARPPVKDRIDADECDCDD